MEKFNHGHMEEVGYETYCELLQEAMKEIRGEKIEKQKEIKIDLDVTAFIPNSYIPNSSQKIEIYQTIALVNSEEDIRNVIDELIDRYSVIPKEVENLIKIARIKYLGKDLDIVRIHQRTNHVLFYLDQEDFAFNTIPQIANKYNDKIHILNSTDYVIKYKLDSTDEENVIKEVKEFLEDIISIRRRSNNG